MQPQELHSFDQGGGYAAPQPVVHITPDLIPIPVPVVLGSDYEIPVDEKVTVFEGQNGGTFRLMPATGSGRTHTIIHQGRGELRIQCAGSDQLLGRSYQKIRNGDSAILLDHQLYSWSVI